MKIRHNQAGFGAIGGIVIVVVVTVIAGAGFYVINKDAKKTNKTTTNPVSSTVANDTSKQGEPAKAPEPDTKYLEVPEMGVKLKLTDNIQDAYYTVNSSSASGVSLRVRSLDFEEQCKSGELSIVGLFKVQKDATDEITGQKFSETRKGVVIGESFFYAQGAQYGCANSAKGQEILDKVRKEFTDASATIEKL